MATTTATSLVSLVGLLLAGLLLGGHAWPASRVTTQPYGGTDAVRGLETPPTVIEARHLEPTMGYLKVSALTMRTPGVVARALLQLGRVQHLVLDLRGTRAAASTPHGTWPSCSYPQGGCSIESGTARASGRSEAEAPHGTGSRIFWC